MADEKQTDPVDEVKEKESTESQSLSMDEMEEVVGGHGPERGPTSGSETDEIGGVLGFGGPGQG